MNGNVVFQEISSSFKFDFPEIIDIPSRYKKIQNIRDVMRKLQQDAKSHKKIIKNDFYSGKAIRKTLDGYAKYIYVHCRQKNCKAKLIYQISPQTPVDKVCQRLVSAINKNIACSRENTIKTSRFYILRKFNVHHTHNMEYQQTMIHKKQLFKAEQFVANLTKNCENNFQIKDVKQFMEENWKISNQVFYNKYYPLICMTQQIQIELKTMESLGIKCINLKAAKSTDLFPNIMIITPKMMRRILKYGECLYFHIKNIDFRSQERYFHWGEIYVIDQHLKFLQVATIILGQNIFTGTIDEIGNQNKGCSEQNCGNSKQTGRNKQNKFRRTQIFTEIFDKFLTQAQNIRKTNLFTFFSKQSEEISDYLAHLKDKFRIRHFYLVNNFKNDKTESFLGKEISIFQDARIFSYPSVLSQLYRQVKVSDEKVCEQNLQKMKSFMHERDFNDFMIDFEKNLGVSQYLRQKFFSKFKKSAHKYFISQLSDENGNPVFCNNLFQNDIQKHIRNRIQNSINSCKSKLLEKYFLRLIRYISHYQRNKKLQTQFQGTQTHCEYCPQKQSEQFEANSNKDKSQKNQQNKKEQQKRNFISSILFKRFPQLQKVSDILCPKIYNIIEDEFISLRSICNHEKKITKEGQIFYEISYTNEKITVFKISNGKVQCSCKFSIRYGFPCRHELYICLQEQYNIESHIKDCWKKSQNCKKNNYFLAYEGQQDFIKTNRRYPLRQRSKRYYTSFL